MQDVEVQVGDAAANLETPMASHGPVPFPSHTGGSKDVPTTPPGSGSTETRKSSASDLPKLDTPAIRIVEPDENNIHTMQEFYPPPSPNSPSPSGSSSDEALINRLDSVSP